MNPSSIRKISRDGFPKCSIEEVGGHWKIDATDDRRHARRFLLTAARWTVVAVLTIGMGTACRHDPARVKLDETAGCVCVSELFWLSPVRIVPVCRDGGDNHILMSFCGELATALLDHRVPDVRIEDECKCPCPADPPGESHFPELEVEASSGVVMYVAIPDFRPYRPMRMAVDVRVVQAVDGREVARIVDVFEGPHEAPLRESPRQFRLFREVEREERADQEAYTAFFSNSPRRFLTGCAQRVVNRIRYTGPLAAPVEPPPLPDTEPLLLDPAIEPDEGPVLPEL